MRSDRLEEYAVDRYIRTVTTETAVTREHIPHSGVRVTVAKDRCGGGPLSPDWTGRLTPDLRH
jgi:hypothetical protein